ncbi:hypothetical protein DFA_11448 [Cavenderia fasciculata]|uniref:Uncharacterized protein n=1 Tax=Cavenderia fasciculata TaxID=261658 RepID=F4QD06_CACFS|nr:uncharacterized protein DFA_11448 [Cavenderia fasciculata]EGG13687.1 hypothetical protein DFA_11448 [Cavenderia fasciculata]|eukprot:XP_004350391.1 hypothetical protein DFA_11448 [Cavenderia fasciculata]
MSCSKIAIISIDLGSSLSSFSYSFIHQAGERGNDPNIYAHDWEGGGGSNNSKTLTLVGLDDGDNLQKFGYEARSYPDLNLYAGFKMKLFDSSSRENSMVKAINTNRKVSVKKLITETLRYFKRVSLDRINLSLLNKLQPSDIMWVLTVPAIWDDAAKHIMRQCAVDAGLCVAGDKGMSNSNDFESAIEILFYFLTSLISNLDSVLLCFEPEAGALDCVFETLGEIYQVKVGEKLLILDNGGGTCDFVGKLQLDHGKFEDIVAPFGGPWGSINVNDNFKKFLVELLGKEVEEHMEGPDFVSLMDTFEVLKRSISNPEWGDGKPRNITMNPKNLFGKSAEWVNEKIKLYNTKNGTNVEFKSSIFLSLPMKVIKSFFEPLFEKIIKCIKDKMNYNPLLKNPTYIFMIGGFSENYFLQELVKKEFASTGAKFIIPSRPSLSVVKGATRFGFSPSTTIRRIIPRSYAIEMDEPITTEKPHVGQKPFMINGKPYARNVCDVYVQAEQKIGYDEVITKTYLPTRSDQKFVELAVFSSTLPKMLYSTDPGISFIADLMLSIPQGGTLEDRKIEATMKFGRTELEVSARHIKSGTKVDTVIDFAMNREEAERRNKIRMLKSKSPRVQLCILMDVTGSMKPWIDQAKCKMVDLATGLSSAHTGIQLEVSFIGYRDLTDATRFEVIPFTTDMASLQISLTPIEADGGKDCPEDIVGGFQQVLSQVWKEGYTKVCVHVADAPCHGTKYHSLTREEDSYPDGDSTHPEEQIRTMKGRGIDYYFVRINHLTDKMIEVFRSTYDTDQKKIVVVNLGSDFGQLIPSIVTFVSNSITKC